MNDQINSRIKSDKEEWVKKYSRFGMAAKGLVYLLIGALTAIAAFNLGGGQKAGKEGAFQFVLQQPFGKVLLGFIAVSLVGYVVWRGVQTIRDPEDEGTKRRIGYAFSGLFYATVAVSAFIMIFQGGGGNGSGGGSGSQEKIVSMLLGSSFGKYLVIAISLIFFAKAIWQFYRAYSGKFDDKVEDQGMDRRVQKTVRISGKIGYTARGVVISIIGVLFLQAALQADPSEAGGTKEAFSTIQNSSYGSILLGIIALGLVAYGIFMFIKAKNRIMPSL
jgi:hypothetical protein